MNSITQAQRDILYQSSKELHSKIEILNKNFKVINSLQGNLINDSYSIDAQSDMRRTYNCSLAVTSSSFILKEHGEIWLNNYVRPWVGIKHARTGQIEWFLMGTFISRDINYSDDDSYVLDLACNDLVSTINGEYGGQMERLKIKIEAGASAYKVIAGLLKDAGITAYLMEDVEFEIPYDLEFSAGTTIYEILSEIKDLYSGYEMGFDVYGTFFIRKIPMRFEDNVILTHADLKPLVISESHSTNLGGIYNHVQVWGQVIEADRYVSASALSGNTYAVKLPEVSALEEIDNFEKIAFRVAKANPAAASISINGWENLPIVNDEGNPLAAGTLTADEDAVFRYRRRQKTMYYLGKYQVFGEAYDENPDSPFTVERLGKELLMVCEGGDYDQIYSNDLAAQRARYEIYNHTVLSTALDFQMVQVPWLDVNQKISYILKGEQDEKQYITKSIHGSTTEGTMSMSCISFYPSYKYKL